MIKKIVVVGGGFAGWYTSAALQFHIPNLEITQIESPNIPRLRVGETLGFGAPELFKRLIGLYDEQELMRQTGSIYKFGVHNINFANDNEFIAHGSVKNYSINALNLSPDRKQYSHGPDNIINLLEHPPSTFPGIFEAWLKINQNNPNRNAQQFIDEMYDSSHFCLNPILPFDQDHAMILNSNHTYHFDAEEMVSYLKKIVISRSKNSAFIHIVSNVVGLEQDHNGAIVNVLLDNQERISGDLFVDCSGIGRVLAKHTHQGLWIDLQGYNNSAWVCPTKYDDPEKEMSCATKIIGEDYGWRFVVNLFHRQGNGYVFNDNLIDNKIVGDRLDKITNNKQLVAPRLIKWNPGLFQQSWFHNCLTLGVANCFFDPWDAPIFSEHSHDLWDLLDSIKAINRQTIDFETVKKSYNKKSFSRSEERRIRYLSAHGLSNRSGPYWDHVRQMFILENTYKKFQNIASSGVTGNINIYTKLIVLNNIDISTWPLSNLVDQDLLDAQKYFLIQRQKNKQIRNQTWPNAYQWFKENLFNGATSQEVYEEFSNRH